MNKLGLLFLAVGGNVREVATGHLREFSFGDSKESDSLQVTWRDRVMALPRPTWEETGLEL